MKSFVCVGHVMTDVLAVLDGPIVRGSDAPARVQITHGGSAANVASWLAAQGHDVVLAARVGQDEAGDSACAALEQAGVRLAVARDPALPTGTCVVLVTPDGERTMVPDAGANARLGPADIPSEVFGPDVHLHVSGYALLHPGSHAAARQAMDHARSAGCTISADASSAALLEEVGPREFLDWVRPCTVLFANAEEAAVLSGAAAPAAAARALTEAVPRVVVTMGAEGALCADAGIDDVQGAPALDVDAVDTTGAGDAFTAGFLGASGSQDAAGFLEGFGSASGSDPIDALDQVRAGCALAARAVVNPGARPAARNGEVRMA